MDKRKKLVLCHIRKTVNGVVTYKPIYHPDEPQYIMCCECNNPISGYGGPKANAVCRTCYNPSGDL